MKHLFIICLYCLMISCKKNNLEENTHTITHLQRSHYLSAEKGHGKLQSPINIVSSKDSAHAVIYNYEHIPDKSHSLTNEAKTISIDYTGGNTFIFDGKTYEFEQLHFHTPSEHLIDGITYPLEMHLIHKHIHSDGSKNYLVLVLLFKEGKQSDFFEELIQNIPTEISDRVVLPPKSLNIHSLAHRSTVQKDFDFFHYKGSLHTFPHTEGIEWIIAKHIFEASPKSIQRIYKMENDNATHIKELFGSKQD